MISHQRQTSCVLTSIKQGMLKCAIATMHTHTKKNRLSWNAVVKCSISHATEPDYCYKNYLKMVNKHVNYGKTKESHYK